MCHAGDVSHRGCVAQGMCRAGDVSRRGCVAQGMCRTGDVLAGDVLTQGMFSNTRLRSQCQFGTFLYVILEVTSNVMMPFWPWMYVVSIAQPEQDGLRCTNGFFLKLAGWVGMWPAYEDGWASGYGDGMRDGSTGRAGW